MKTGDIVQKIAEMKCEFMSKAFIHEEDIVFYMPRYFQRLLVKDLEDSVTVKRKFSFEYDYQKGQNMKPILRFMGIDIIDGYENKVIICHRTEEPLSNIKLSFQIP